MSIPYAPSQSEKPARSWGVRHLMYAVVWAAVIIAFLVRFWMLALILLVTFAPIVLVVGIIALLLANRGTKREAILKVMAISAEREMPMSPGLQAFSELCSGSLRPRVWALASTLQSGTPLPEALRRLPGLIPRSSAILASVGYETGALRQGLKQAIADQDARKAFRAALLPRLMYLLFLLSVIFLITTYQMYYITPKIQMIVSDYGGTLPALTSWLITVSHFLSPLIPILLLALLLACASLLLWQIGLLPGWFYFVGQFFSARLDRATLLRALAVGTSANKPIELVLQLLEKFSPRSWMKGRLNHARARMEQGLPWLDALAQQGLIQRGDVALLESAQRVGNLPWVLETLADSQTRRFNYKLASLAHVIFPLVVVGLGAMVFVIAVGFLAPLVKLIEGLT